MADYTVAGASDQVAVEQAPFPFWKLPWEVRDMIFDLVYGGGRIISVIARDEWAKKERIKRREDPVCYVPTPFPEPGYSCMLVSKQYIDEAAAAYLKRNTFHLPIVCDATRLLRSESIHQELFRCISHLRADTVTNLDGSTFRMMPCLKRLEVELHCRDIVLDNKLPWIEYYSDLDIVRLPLIVELLKFRGLRELTIRSTFLTPEVATPAKAQHVQDLLQRIQDLLNDVTKQPKLIEEGSVPLRTVSEMLERASTTNQSTSNKISTPFQHPNQHPTPSSTIAEMPKNEGDFVRLFYSDPHAVFNWVQSANSRLSTISRLIREPMTGNSFHDKGTDPKPVIHGEAGVPMKRKQTLHPRFRRREY